MLTTPFWNHQLPNISNTICLSALTGLGLCFIHHMDIVQVSLLVYLLVMWYTSTDFAETKQPKRSCLVLQNTCGKVPLPPLFCVPPKAFKHESVESCALLKNYWLIMSTIRGNIFKHKWLRWLGPLCEAVTCTVVIPKTFYFHIASGSQDSSYPLLNVSKMSN